MGFAAGLTRLELATSGLTGRRSNQLNYSPKYEFRFFLIYLGKLKKLG